jgi:hypothetical protein
MPKYVQGSQSRYGESETGPESHTSKTIGFANNNWSKDGTSAQSPFADEGNPVWHQLGSRRENFADTQVVSIVGWRYILDRDRKAAGGIQDRLHLHPVGVAGT